MLEPAFAAGALNENPAHGLGSRGEEMASAVPVLGLVRAYQPQIGFMDQGGGFERLAGFLLSDLLGGQAAQLLVNQWQKLLDGVWLALFKGGQDTRNFTHGC